MSGRTRNLNDVRHQIVILYFEDLDAAAKGKWHAINALSICVSDVEKNGTKETVLIMNLPSG